MLLLRRSQWSVEEPQFNVVSYGRVAGWIKFGVGIVLDLGVSYLGRLFFFFFGKGIIWVDCLSGSIVSLSLVQHDLTSYTTRAEHV